MVKCIEHNLSTFLVLNFAYVYICQWCIDVQNFTFTDKKKGQPIFCCFTYITWKLSCNFCMKYIWSIYNRRELWNSLFMSPLIFYLGEKTYVKYILQTISSKYLFFLRKLQEKMSNSRHDIPHCWLKLLAYLSLNFLKVNAGDLCEPCIWLKYSNSPKY